jgi:hypothetical protein
MATDQTTSENARVLRIDGPRLGQVREVVDLLDDLEHAYNSLYVFESLVDRIQEEKKPYGWGSRAPKFGLVPRSRVAGFVLPADKLKLYRIEFRSPGFWEFLGSLSPLEVLRKWASDRHERRKDFIYREQYEAERMRLENENLKTEVVQDRVRLLEQAGVPQEKIREALTRYLVEPLGRLERHQDAGMLGTAELVRRDEDNREPS